MGCAGSLHRIYSWIYRRIRIKVRKQTWFISHPWICFSWFIFLLCSDFRPDVTKVQNMRDLRLYLLYLIVQIASHFLYFTCSALSHLKVKKQRKRKWMHSRCVLFIWVSFSESSKEPQCLHHAVAHTHVHTHTLQPFPVINALKTLIKELTTN